MKRTAVRAGAKKDACASKLHWPHTVAFKRTTEMTYDAAAWLFHDKRVPMGEITTTVYTAGQQYVIGDA